MRAFVDFASPFPPTARFAHVALGGALPTPHPDEARALGPRAVDKRRREFAGGRAAARTALAALGLDPPPPVPAAADRAPIWPEGVVGAITHTRSDALAAVARRADCGGLGLDLEHLGGLRRLDVARQVADADERAWIGADLRRLLAVFSAKESIYKALYPRHGRYFGFGAVTLTPTDAGFEATLNEALGPGYPAGSRVPISVRWYGDQVLTAVWLPADTP